MLDRKEIDIEIARLEYGESSYPAYAKLANLYTIRSQMDRTEPMAGIEPPSYDKNYSSAPAVCDSIKKYGSSEFLNAIEGQDSEIVWSIMDELMDTLKVVNRRAYDGVMRKINSL